MLLHDPQTAGMVGPLVETGVPVIWRSHVGLDVPNDRAREAWRFLIGYVERADAYVFSRPAYTWEGLDEAKVTVIPPSIDAFSPKNHAMSFTSVTAVLRAAGLAADHHQPSRAIFERLDGSVGKVVHSAHVVEEYALRLDAPLVAQVSRWDRLKDPMGIVSAFAEHVHADEQPHLLLAGPDVTAVADDPEGAEVFEEIEAAWHALPQRVRRRVHLALLPMDEADENAVIVNALQRRADVVAQKSLAEGFGLTVSEAMWKGRPGRRVGRRGHPGPDRGRAHRLPRRTDRPRRLRRPRQSPARRPPFRRAHGRGRPDARARPVPRPAPSGPVRGAAGERARALSPGVSAERQRPARPRPARSARGTANS